MKARTRKIPSQMGNAANTQKLRSIRERPPQSFRVERLAWIDKLAIPLVALVLIGSVFYRQIVQADRWIQQSRLTKIERVPSVRGVIYDRKKRVLAISERFSRVVVNNPQAYHLAVSSYSPKQIRQLDRNLQYLADGLNMDVGKINNILSNRDSKKYFYKVLKSNLQPQLAHSLLKNKIPGIKIEDYRKRIYPMGEWMAQVVGIMRGKKGGSGLEKTYDQRLSGKSGLKVAEKSRSGAELKLTEEIPAKDGDQLTISIDADIQKEAYFALRDMVQKKQAINGSLVLMNTMTGEILAMAGYPAYDPNNRAGLQVAHMKNYATTDLFEPGSTMKPFFMALALENNRVKPEQLFDLNRGRIMVSGYPIYDSHVHPELTAAEIIIKSSNVGIVKVSENLAKQEMGDMLKKLRFGDLLLTSLPGSARGVLNDYRQWFPLDKASISFGYGMSTSLLQLVRAYSVFAREGKMIQPTLIKSKEDDKRVNGKEVFSKSTIKKVNAMLEKVVSEEGTATQAQLEGYRVAGKTSTSRKSVHGQYVKKYVSSFVGFAPASRPHLLMGVLINEPSMKGKQYYGGLTAAPVFAKVMKTALRIIGALPDQPMRAATQKPKRDKESS